MTFDIQYSLLESTSQKPVTKQMSLLPDGTIQKESLAHNLTPGRVYLCQKTTTQFAETLQTLKPYQALAYGIPKMSEFNRLITKRDQDNGQQLPGDITRTNDNFVYPNQSGIFCGDVDHPKVMIDELLEVLRDIDPELIQSPMIYRPSAGSCIYNKETSSEIVGVNGYRLYIVVNNASLIPEFGTLLHKHFWLHGHGHFEISKAGSYLDRGVFDTSVWQPSRIDFAGGAVCAAQVEQRLPPPQVINPDAPLDIKACIERLQLDDNQNACLNELKATARLELADQAQQIRASWMQNRIQEMTTHKALDPTVAENVLRQAIEKQVLSGDFLITLQSGDVVTVDEILADQKRYHGQRCADPVERDYDLGHRVGYISLELGRNPMIWSHAHGGTCYQLVSTTRPSLIALRGKTAFTVDRTIDELRKDPLIFNWDQVLVRVTTNKQNQPRIQPLTKDGLEDYLGHRIQYQRYAGKKELIDIDPPDAVCRGVLARNEEERDLNSLRGICTAPILRLDGSVVDQPGYDSATGLVLSLPSESHPVIPNAPNVELAKDALAYIWKPFKDFPFIDDLARSVFIAALLTAPIRKNLPTAPAYAFNAFVAGSGKTLLAKCISVLNDGQSPKVMAHVSNDDEMRKRLLSHLINGNSVILIDNVTGLFTSSTLEALLTTETYSDRLLGVSKMISMPMIALILITGNNLKFVGDLNRRVLISSINPNVENPYLRSFELDPLDYVKKHRQEMVRAILLIIRAYLSSGAGRIAAGSMASFEDWDRLVRQTICWLSTLPGCPLSLTDPAQSIARGYDNDPITEQLRRVLIAWRDCYGDTHVTAKQVITDLIQVANNKDERLEHLHDALVDAIGSDKSGNAITAKQLSAWIGQNTNRQLDGRVLIKDEKKINGYAKWYVKDSNPTLPLVKVGQVGQVGIDTNPLVGFPLSCEEPPTLMAWANPFDSLNPFEWMPPSTTPTTPLDNPFAD